MAGEDRSEQATPKRKQEARKKGQVVRSRDLTSAFSLLSVVLLLELHSGLSIGTWRNLLSQMLNRSNAGDLATANRIASSVGLLLTNSLAGPFLLVWSVAVLTSVAQGGIVFSPEALEPKLGRLNPVENIGNLFSAAGMSRLLKSLVPAAAILYIAIGMIQRDWMMIVFSSRASVRPLMAWMVSRAYELSWKSCMVLLAWSAVDYFLQQRQMSNSLKMSKQEVLREAKDAEPSALLRGQMRKRRREMRQRWSMKDVERATAVITNPNHFAVALEYRPQSMPAPIVVAKGMNEIALRIKDVARWQRIPIVENPPLAQALYRATEVGEAIPAKLYTAVAEILAFLYRTQANLRNSMRANSAAGSAPGAGR